MLWYTDYMQNLLEKSVSTIWLYATDGLLCLLLLWSGWRIIRGKMLIQNYRQVLRISLLIILISFFCYQLYSVLFYLRNGFGRLLLPPHSYFFYHQFGAALSNILSGLIASAVILFFGLWLVHQKKMTQFGTDDWLGLSLGTLAVGWPAVLPFLGLTIAMSIFGFIFQILLRKKTLTDRLVITPYIMPAGIVVLVAKAQILALTHLDKIRF